MDKRPRVAIVGAGMAGLFCADQLSHLDYDVTVYEKNADVGGTWLLNDYPGLHVDVLTRSYEFSHYRAHTWSKRYAPGSEVGSYLKEYARAQGLYPLITFNRVVTRAEFVGDGWRVSTDDGTTAPYDFVFVATGFLHVPKMPRITGAESFAGPAFHSSKWDHSLDLEGKRIGVIGTGSSGIQIVTEMGKQGHDVVHFIRTPQWIQVKENPRISWLERTLLRVPALSSYWDKRMAALRVKTDGPETWRLRPGPDRDDANARFHADLVREIPDPELRAKLTPTEPLGCKRIPKSPDYYRVVQQDNVEPVFGGLDHVEAHAVVDAAGVSHPVDVLVYATGFETHAYMRPMEIVGASGTSINDLWEGSVFSYRGVGLPQMPNLFLLNGPFAPINSLSVPIALRDEMGFLVRVLELIRSEGQPMAPTAAATERFVGTIREQLPNTTYSLCDNWYTDASGTQVLWPFTRAQHGEQYAVLEREDFETFGRVPADR